MKRLAFRMLAAVLVVLGVVASCKGDPTADERGGPARIDLSPNQMFLDSGTTRSVTVTVRDNQLNPVTSPVQVSTTAPGIFTVAIDTTSPTADGARSTYIVTANAPGEASLVVETGGISDTAIITVLLPAVPFAYSDTTPIAGATFTIRASPTHKFTDTTEVIFGGDVHGLIHLAVPDSVVVVAPFASTPGPVTLTNISVLYHAGLVQDLPTTQPITVGGDLWPAGDSAFATAPDLFATLGLPAVGDSVHTITNFNLLPPDDTVHTECAEWGPEGPAEGFSTGPCVKYQFTVPGPDSLNLLFRIDWDNDADIDAYSCDDTATPGCFESGGTAASGRHPEFLNMPLVGGVRTPTPFKYAPGTHYLVLELFDGPPPNNMYLTIYRQ